jgi:hypothetical protein
MPTPKFNPFHMFANAIALSLLAWYGIFRVVHLIFKAVR